MTFNPFKKSLDYIAKNNNTVLDNTAEKALKLATDKNFQEENVLSPDALRALKNQIVEDKYETFNKIPKDQKLSDAYLGIKWNRKKQKEAFDLGTNGSVLLTLFDTKLKEINAIKEKFDRVMIWNPITSQETLDNLKEIYNQLGNQNDTIKNRIKELEFEKKEFEEKYSLIQHQLDKVELELNALSIQLEHPDIHQN